MNRRRKIGLILLGLVAAPPAFVAWSNWQIARSTESRIFVEADTVPKRQVGLVLGTTPKVRGVPNPFFEHRLDAAADLYKAGRVKCLLVSGDHGTRYYNEVDAMRKGLVKRGVPNAKIAMDHAGFRTLDSLVRAKKVFGVNEAVVVTDGFHLPRSLYLARQFGIDAVGLSSVPVSLQVAPQPATREIAARALMMIDVMVGRGPKYLGPSERLPG